MVVVIIGRENWQVRTIRNVTSITWNNGSVTVVGNETVTADSSLYVVRIMEN